MNADNPSRVQPPVCIELGCDVPCPPTVDESAFAQRNCSKQFFLESYI
jgi:hypothetical protein